MYTLYGFLGTGKCSSSDIYMGSIGRIVVLLVTVMLIFLLIRKLFIQPSILNTLVGIVLLFVILLAAAALLFIIAIGTACSGNSGWF